MEDHGPPRVSVVMAARNTDKWIGAAIESVLAQTLADLELLIVDNGSTDGTPGIVARYAASDARIRTFRLEGPGVVAARNLAIQHARGEYVAIMDSDDLSMPDRLARQVRFLDEHPDVLAVASGVAVINRQLAVPRDLAGLKVRVPSARPVGRLSGVNPKRPHIFHPPALIRRDAMLEVGLYRPFFVHAEDADLFMRLEELGPLCGVPEVLYLLRKHLKNTTLRFPYVQTESSVLAQIVARRRRRGKPDRAHARKRPFLRVFQIGLAPHEIVHALLLIGARYIRRLVVSRRRRRQLVGV